MPKLQREQDRLRAEVTSDNVFNFVVTAYHIVDWIKNSTLGSSVKTAVRKMRGNPYIAVCRDLANASKHFELDQGYPNQVVDQTSVQTGFGRGRYGKGAYGIGEPTIVIVLMDGTRYDVLELSQKTVDAWQGFFAAHGLWVSPRERLIAS